MTIFDEVVQQIAKLGEAVGADVDMIFQLLPLPQLSYTQLNVMKLSQLYQGFWICLVSYSK